jgi:hypothetical protein
MYKIYYKDISNDKWILKQVYANLLIDVVYKICF